ncbi:MAG TPA: 16S rRNA processing protein RimM, partial [Aminobacteriaceae bacterium]|nr:16S rRNA processing protein RimM [Aminobacteriaceae bacterium]
MNRVRIGRIVGTHGLRGALKIVPLTDYPERFHSMEKMSVYSAEGQIITTLTLLSSRYSDHKKLLVIQTEELRRI